MRFLIFVGLATMLPFVAHAAPPVAPGGLLAGALTYPDLVDLVIASPIVAGATIAKASRLKPADVPGLAAGSARFYVRADVAALIRGRDGLPTAVNYLADVPLDSRGRAPKLKKLRVLLLAQAVPGRAASLRLASPRAQLDWTADAEARIRGIVRDLVAADAPPAITGIANAFHVPGSLPGESETQIFLTTADKRPISLAILRKPDEQPRWAVALGEMVDEAAGPPKPETLLWYRLACGLPPALPDEALASLSDTDAAAARADYALVKRALGRCVRTS